MVLGSRSRRRLSHFVRGRSPTFADVKSYMTTFFDQSKESLVDLKKLMKWVSEIKLTEIGGESCEDDKEETPDQESATPGNSVNKVNSKY